METKMSDECVYSFELFGDKYKFQTSDGNKKALEGVVNYFKKIVDDLYKAYPYKSRQELLVLAGVTISDRLYQTAKHYEQNASPVEKANCEFLKETIKKIDENL